MNDDFRRQADAHFKRGNQFDENDQRDRAITEWQEALEFDPAHIGAHFNLGIAFAEAGELFRAVEYLKQVIHLDMFDTEARRILAEIYLELEQPDEAINQLRQLLNSVPGDAQAAHLLAQTYLGLEMWDQAAGALEGGAMLEEDAELWFELGQAYQTQARRIDDAILAYRRALIAQPEHIGARRALQHLNVPIEEPGSEEADEDS